MRCNVTTRRSHRGRSLTTGMIAVLGLWAAPVEAVEPSQDARYPVEQPAQGLADSLRSIARQTGISVLFDPAAVRGRMARPVSGRLSAVEAISQALDGTGLVAEVMPDGSVVVRPAAAGGGAGAPMPAGRSSGPQTRSAGDAIDGARLDLAQAPVHADPVVAPATSADSASGQKIEVTGSRLKRVETEGPLPVNTYTREDIDRSGQPTLERFLGSLNEVSMSPGEGTYGVTAGQGSVQLRGLPLGSTLVLINGRRVQAVGSSSANFFNLNLIPLAAVERVEIVPVGSSAVYGGDALAGVVNVILKKSIDGFSLNARLGSGRGVGDGSLSIATGGRGDEGSYLLLGSYSKGTPLTMAERAFFTDADYRRFGGPDTRSRNCTPGTVSSTTADNLPGLNAGFAAIPAASPGQPLTVADFVATAGQARLCSSVANGHGYALVHGTESFGLHAAGERRLSGSWSLFGELTHADDRLHTELTGLQLNNVLVPASNAYNPFGVPVKVTARLGLQNGAEGLDRQTRYTRAVFGVRGDLASDWDFEASASTSRDDGTRTLLNNTVNAAARNAALADATPAALDPFTAGPAASEDVLRTIWSDAIRANHGRKDQLGAFVRGSLVELPAGPMEAIAGVEYARDRYETSAAGSGSIVDSRTSSAVYGEFRVPLLRARGARGRGWNLAALTVAGRRDRYSDFGSAQTQQAGLELRPARTLLLRAAAATSFKPPTLLQTGVDDESLTTDIFGLVDPARGGEPIVGGEVLRTANADLRPERGRAWSLGALWEPESSVGSRLGLTAWRVKIDDLIALQWPQVTLDNEALFPGFVTRGPSVDGQPGPVTRVLYAELNFGSVDIGGVDMEAAHVWTGPLGRWSLAASATRMTQYEVVIAPGAPADDRLGRRASDYWAPEWKARLSAGFDAGSWSIGVTSRYLGGYKDSGSSDRALGNFWTHDLSGRLDLKRLGWGFGAAKAAALSLAIVNVADRQPQFVETAPYYDITQADWRGRYASLRLSVDW